MQTNNYQVVELVVSPVHQVTGIGVGLGVEADPDPLTPPLDPKAR